MNLRRQHSKKDKPDEGLAAIAIDSTGLKEFGKDEWHQGKHEINSKLTLLSVMSILFVLCGQVDVEVDVEVDHISADKMYDTDDVYDALTSEFPETDVAIPPK
ncbi:MULTISPECIES: hypothetical protein [unclassified Vibrio]|uniref:hypothetical protein n=1 Tax=unclassified Vibrio TaxID=2614977 RepID=UPI001F274627|nr:MULTISPECIES: hypothetical protein [unclassified Vibrio]MCF7507171.1 hypothetical protein [Vibrio sp. L3-7]MDA0155903.1 hypothetical protein [Vibrio sp. Makdt]CAH7051513.1 hypothetical protein VCHA29O37_580002 [Vibrio chagasii]